MAQTSYMGVGIALGVALGAGVGVATDNLAIGISLGVAIGLAIGVALDAGRKSRDGSGPENPAPGDGRDDHDGDGGAD